MLEVASKANLVLGSWQVIHQENRPLQVEPNNLGGKDWQGIQEQSPVITNTSRDSWKKIQITF